MKKKQKFFDTSIELKIEEALKSLKVKYVKQFYIESVTTTDFYVPESNLIIEADGCYFHSCPIHSPHAFKRKAARDVVITNSLRMLGYKVLRIWEHDINSFSKAKLKKLIKTML